MKKVGKGKQILLFIIIQNIFIYCQSFSFTSNTLTSTSFSTDKIISATYKSAGVVATCQQNMSGINALTFSNTYVASQVKSYSSSENCISVQFYQSATQNLILSIFQQSGTLLNYGSNQISLYNTLFSTSSNTYTQTVSVYSSVQSQEGNVNHQTFNNCTNQVIGLWYSQIDSVNLVFAACGASTIFIYDKSIIPTGHSVQQTIYYPINTYELSNNINLIKFIKMGVDANYTCGAVSKYGSTYIMYVFYYSSNAFYLYKTFSLNNDFVDIYGLTNYFMVLQQNLITVFNFDGNTLGQSQTISNQFTLFSFLDETDFMTVDNQNNIQIWTVTSSTTPCPYYCKCLLGSSICTSCPSNSNRASLDINNKCLCNPGFYDDGVSQICLICHSSCKTCNGPNDNNCQSCQDGYFLVSGQCQQCDYSCQTCQNTNNFCLSCNQYLGPRTLNAANGTCLCTLNYIENQNKICSCTNDYCLTCNPLDGFQCQSCKNNTSWNLTSDNKCECKDQFYFDSSSNDCQNCNFPCIKCQNSSTSCTSCKNTATWQLLNNTCSCKEGYYLDSSSQECQVCPSLCSKCDSSTQCTSCKNSSSMQLINQICECKDGYYLDISSNDCKSCNFPCLKCQNSSSYCTSCKNTTEWQLVNNSCSCKAGYYLDSSSQECQACPSLCSECNSSTQCTSCKNSSSMQLINQICECKDGYYFDISSNDCLPCPPLCSACTSSNFCTSCKNSTSMQIFNNMCECSSGFHLSQDQRNCKNCSNICQTCSNDPNYCLSCRDSPGLSLDKSKNTCYCTDGYYFDITNQMCQQCSSNCKTCKDYSSYCLSCYTSYYLANNQCSKETLPTNISQKTIETLKQTTQSATYISIGSSTASSLIFSIASPNGGAVQQFMSVQKLYFLLFLDIVYPQLIYTFFKTLSGTSPLILFKKINLFSYFIQEDQNQIINQTTNGIAFTEQQYKNNRLLQFQDYIPNKFQAEKVTSSVVQNGGGPIISILAIWILVLPILLISFFRKENQYGNLLKSSSKESSFYTQIVTTKERIYYYYKTIISILTVMLHETINIVLSFSIILQIIFLLNLQNNQFQEKQIEFCLRNKYK
ncbi:EGF-like domain protein (macronuclear) [Tetrahymena thermophila SB210]|uniref:EGF-like domain protein n=1 Tax=Tetrahymena thermophila (strain SB210) TaxID=312017 RepID=I7MA99_TETTS|nr:EGF-like domain protein [Tetrahymena thermophila SB210]EAS03980.2 EGF-like domain protein [Tetrahymena thermophila SB210]|eukprot:XP_001024225.2 EGF-like domain protein [Tetrahymena thermophila SB210]